MVVRFLPADAVAEQTATWARDYRVLAPVREGSAVVYRTWARDMRPFLGRPPTSSAKQALLPQTENLFTYTYRKNKDDLTKTEVFLSEALPPEPTLVLGSRPCDARGAHLLDRVFLERGVVDTQYKKRRDVTLFVSLACRRMENTCFCHWTGGGPYDESGSDVMLYAVTGGYAARALTPAGEKLVSGLAEASPEIQKELADALANPPEAPAAPDLSSAPESFLSVFDDMDFWMDESARCLSCGACTYLCPVCSCFNITDENSGMQGRRVRTWDSCMSALYTLEGSGYNPRSDRARRLRNRVGHKFSYHPHEVAKKTKTLEFSCTGCGRCIKSCPVSVDIRRVVLDMIARGAKAAAPEVKS